MSTSDQTARTVRIRAMRSDEQEPVIDLLSHAFAADPVITSMLNSHGAAGSTPDAAAARRIYRQSVTELLSQNGIVDVADLGPGTAILGAAMWTDSHSERVASRRHTGLRATWDRLRSLAVLGPGTLRRVARHERAVASHRPGEDHWYLHDIGVAPSGRGQGIGTALLRHRLDLIRSAGPRLVFLEASSDGSRRLYERLGFSVHARIDGLPGTQSVAMTYAG